MVPNEKSKSPTRRDSMLSAHLAPKNNANFNLASLYSQKILKRFIKESHPAKGKEEDDEICKRIHRGMLKKLGGEHFEPVGILYIQNPFAVKKTSKFKSRTDQHNENLAKRRMTINAK